jgi:tetratricopeptide (TPR) repeat protein
MGQLVFLISHYYNFSMAQKVKVTRKEIKKPDKFREAVTNAVVLVSDNYKKILLVFGGSIVILIGAFAIISFFEKHNLEANSKFKEAMADYTRGNYEEALGKFLAIRTEYPKAEVSKIALYYAGAINYDMGKYDESTKLLDDLLSSGVKDEMLKDATYLTLGLSNFNKGNWQQAIDYLSKLDKEESPYVNQAKLHIGLSLEKLGKYSEAEKIYKEMLDKTPSNKGFKAIK